MESLHYLLMKTQALMQKRISAEAQKIGLTPGQPKILYYLYEREGSDQKTIAAYCEIEPATLASVLLRMEQKGLIERRQKQGNRRSLYVYMTEKGRIAAEQMQSIFKQCEAAAQKDLDETKILSLKELLTTVCENLNERGKQDGTK